MTNTLSYSHITNLNIVDICEKQKSYLNERFSLKDIDSKDKLPHIVLFPKFHKPKLSQRFVVSYSSCTVKPIAKRLVLGLKAVYSQICSYSRMIMKVTGIKRNWIIDNNEPLLECFSKYIDTDRARNIQTYDFSTLYTNLRHDEIKTALRDVVKLAFKHSKCSYISIYDKSFSWVKKPRDNTFRFDEAFLIETIEFILDNSYFCMGNIIFRQIVGVPMGVDPGPFIANLTLFYFEYKYLDKLYKLDYHSARQLNNTFRLIDDITSVNSDGTFEEHVKNIYPESLVLNKENTDDSCAHVLDLNISIKHGHFVIGVYDKRDDFPFDIVQYLPKCCNMSVDTLVGIFGSQLTRLFRICNNLDNFKYRTEIMLNKFIHLGFKRIELFNKYRRMAEKHSFNKKFKDVNTLESLFNG